MILRDEYGNQLVLGNNDVISLKDVLMGSAVIGGKRINLSGGTRNDLSKEMKKFLLTKHCRKGSKVYDAISYKNFANLLVEVQYERLVFNKGVIKYQAGQDYNAEIAELKKKIIKA